MNPLLDQYRSNNPSHIIFIVWEIWFVRYTYYTKKPHKRQHLRCFTIYTIEGFSSLQHSFVLWVVRVTEKLYNENECEVVVLLDRLAQALLHLFFLSSSYPYIDKNGQLVRFTWLLQRVIAIMTLLVDNRNLFFELK